MTFKSLALAAVAVTLLSGAAMAQTDNSMTTQSTGTQGSPEPGSMFEDKAKMAPFYSDEAMTMMKTGEEFNSAFNAMSSDDQKRLRDECMNSTSPREAFCESVKNIQ